MASSTLFKFASAALATAALLHVGALLMGPDAIEFLGAPKEFVEGARNGDWAWTAFVTLGIAGLLAGLSFLSFKAKTSDNKILRAILWLFTAIFTMRGLLVFLFVPAIMAGRDGGNPTLFWFHVGASIFVLLIGIALTLALFKTRKSAS